MKKFILLLLVVVCLPVQIVHAQIMPVVDAALNTLMEVSHIEQVIYYGQMVKDNIESLVHTAAMMENMGNQVEMAVKNLRSAKDIHSFSDFMDWYNRALYLDRQTVEAFKNMNITIGKKSYGFLDVEGMADGFNESYVEYWNKEFTEDQRKEMWLGLGLTPSNYAYVQPFRDEMRNWRKQGFAIDYIQNKVYEDQMKRNNARQEKLAKDKILPNAEQMGDKEIQMMILESSMENNKVLNDLAMYEAYNMKLKATEMYLDETPVNQPLISEWPEDGFGPMSRK